MYLPHVTPVYLPMYLPCIIPGELLPSMTCKIVEGESPVNVSQQGELWLRGPNVRKGYLNNPAATAVAIDSDGYFHTGDIGWLTPCSQPTDQCGGS
jgi:long-subunit acyl-CoA synthetase (AMP-forming)